MPSFKKPRYQTMLEESRKRPLKKRRVTAISLFFYFLCILCIALSFLFTQKSKIQAPKEVSNLIEVFNFTYWQLSNEGTEYEAFGAYGTQDINGTQSLFDLTLHHANLSDNNTSLELLQSPLARKVGEYIFFPSGAYYQRPSNFLEFTTKNAVYSIQSKILRGIGEFSLIQRAENQSIIHKVLGWDILYDYQKGTIEAKKINANLELG